MIRNIMLKLIDMKKAIKFFITMYAVVLIFDLTPCESFLHCNNGTSTFKQLVLMT